MVLLHLAEKTAELLPITRPFLAKIVWTKHLVILIHVCFLLPVFYPPQVLRFYAMWDDTKSMFGENRPYIIHYYLADDTVEVREVHKPNDGRDPFPVLIKRQRLPKTFVDKKSKFGAASTSVCAKAPWGVEVDVETVLEVHQFKSCRCHQFVAKGVFFQCSLQSVCWEAEHYPQPSGDFYTAFFCIPFH